MPGSRAKATESSPADRARPPDAEPAHDGPSAAQPGGLAVQRVLAAASSSQGTGRLTPRDVQAVQRKVGNRATAHLLQRKGEDGPASLEVASEGVKGMGQPLPWLDRIQKSFGSHDIRGVKSFRDEGAAAASRAIGAEAYTSGDRVAFASSSPSLHTAAHEAAHVIQQRGGVQLKGGIGQEGDPYERHADAVADGVVQGRSVEQLLAAPPSSSVSGVRPHSSGPAPVQMVRAQDLAELYSIAKMEMEDFNDLVKELSKETGGKPIVRSKIKSMDRALFKAREKEDEGDSEQVAVSSLTDILAGSIVYPSLNLFLRGYQKLARRLPEKGMEIVRLKNRIDKKECRDFLLNIRLVSGYVVELQLHLEPTIDAKMGDEKRVKADRQNLGGHFAYTGHDAYDYNRILEPLLKDLETLEFEDIPDDYMKHELIKVKSMSLALNKVDLASMVELESKKQKTQNSFNAYLTSLGNLYTEIQDELMSNAWALALKDPKSGAALEKIQDIENFDAQNFRQNLRKSGLHWEGMGKTRKAKLEKYRQHFTREAQYFLALQGDPIATTDLQMLKKYYKLLWKKRQEKKVKHADSVKTGALIDQFLQVMKEAITILENQENVELSNVRHVARQKSMVVRNFEQKQKEKQKQNLEKDEKSLE